MRTSTADTLRRVLSMYYVFENEGENTGTSHQRNLPSNRSSCFFSGYRTPDCFKETFWYTGCPGKILHYLECTAGSAVWDRSYDEEISVFHSCG